MKKILSVFLSIIIAASFCVTGFAAELRSKVEPGHIKIVAQSQRIEAGKEYSIPISMLSDYNMEGLDKITDGSYTTGFTVSVGGDAAKYVEIKSIEASKELKYLFYYTEFECQYNELFDSKAYFAFGVDDISILHKDNFVLAYVKIKVSDSYPGGGLTADLILGDYYLTRLNEIGGVNTIDFPEGSKAAVVDWIDYPDIHTYYVPDELQTLESGYAADQLPWDKDPGQNNNDLTFWQKVGKFMLNVLMSVVYYAQVINEKIDNFLFA
ncbi:MAG: hypothetical protein IJT03_05885 [Clostridia bacterium]|nr:hypothetical protein [Clostridia bacterium]